MDRLIRMAFNMLMRRGLRRLSKGQKKQGIGTSHAQKSIRVANKIRRM